MLKPDDTIQFFTSPYRRTRETTEGILKTLTSDDPTPSPFPRHKINVFEEPRLREQDFGNFQPCSAEMERMWQERADYGHFFYRIPDGESAADAYDRVSGFNESLWRQFGDADFPSVCVLVTHGMMTRVFLMKWSVSPLPERAGETMHGFPIIIVITVIIIVIGARTDRCRYHWSVEYFEDLRNVNHCEFIVMKRSDTNGKYILQNELRTWSDLRKRAANGTTPASGRGAALVTNANSSPTIPVRRWGGCVNGCNHDKMNWPRRIMRKNTADFLAQQPQLPPSALDGDQDDHPVASTEADHTPVVKEPVPAKLTRKPSTKLASIPAMPLTPASPNDASDDLTSGSDDGVMSGHDQEKPATLAPRPQHQSAPRTAAILRHLQPPSGSGEGFSDDSDYFPGMQYLHRHHHTSPGKPRARASSKARESKEHKAARKQTEKGWMEESGMGTGARANALGDGDELSDVPPGKQNGNREHNPPILREALKGDMIVENSEEERTDPGDKFDGLVKEKKVDEDGVEQLKEADRKSLSEVY